MSAAFASLLRTKLYIPPRRPHLVLRPRLSEQLNQGLTRKLTLISAPPGFGKTTAISNWIAQSHCAVTWLSLDDSDNDPVRFWSYFITALQMLNAEIGVQSMALLQSPQPLSLDAVLTVLVNEIDGFSDEFALILEDYHLINIQPIHQAMTFLLDHLPPRMHLVLISRSDPPLPLAQLRAHDELIELRIADLRFTVDESTAFFNQTMGLNLSGENIAALEMRTEGWIAGLQLAALSMRGRDNLSAFIEAFAGSNRFVVDYLAEQVLVHQPADIQNFLLRTSILDRMSASLCDTLLDSQQSQSVLEQLEQRNLFILPLDEVREWYRYHQLFADVLRARLRQVDPGAVSGLHQRASRWFAQHDRPSEAIEHALVGQDYEQATQLLEQIGRKFFNNAVMFPALDRWLSKLPDSLLRARPKLVILQAWLLIRRGEIDAAERCTDTAEQALKQLSVIDNTRAHSGEIAALRARLAVNRGTPEQIIEYARQALADLDTENGGIRSQVMVTLGRAHLHARHFVQASEAFAEAVILGRSAGYSYITLFAAYFRAYLQRAAGAPEAALASSQEAIRWAMEYGENGYFEVGIIFVGLADLFREQNDLPHALDYASEGVKRCAQLGDIGFVLLSRLVLARVQQALGDLDFALAEVQATERLARQHQIDWAIHILNAYEAQLRLIQSGYPVPHALDWMPKPLSAGDTERFVRTPYLLVYGYEHNRIAPMQLMIAQGRSTADLPLLHEAIDLLDRQRREADASGLVWLSIKIRALMALAQHSSGNREAAFELLQQALSLAQPRRYIRIFVDEGQPMRALLEQVARQTPVAEYVDLLLSAFGHETSQNKADQAISPPVSRLAEKLSERELQVLRLIQAGASNQEIADQLVISLATVKRHISNIYGKLDATSRTHALVRARELQLL